MIDIFQEKKQYENASFLLKSGEMFPNILFAERDISYTLNK